MVAGQALAGRIGRYAASAEPIQATAFGADPDVTRPIFVDRVDQVARETLLSREGRELTVFEPMEAAAGGADPQAAFAILMDRSDTAVG
jgi:hypothetical protein